MAISNLKKYPNSSSKCYIFTFLACFQPKLVLLLCQLCDWWRTKCIAGLLSLTDSSSATHFAIPCSIIEKCSALLGNIESSQKCCYFYTYNLLNHCYRPHVLLMGTPWSDDCGLFPQDNVLCHKAKWFRLVWRGQQHFYVVGLASKLPYSQSN